MDAGWRARLAFLGAGGERPRFEILKIATWQVFQPCHLMAGESVYAIALNPSKKILAAGTRNGTIHLLAWLENSKDGKSFSSQQIAHGAPVLSVHWVNEDLLAVSDSKHRCSVWNTLQPSLPPIEVQTGKGSICALNEINHGILVGLSTRGELFLWEMPKGTVLQTAQVPPPPRKGAGVSLTHWLAAGALVYPAAGGELVLYDPRTGRTRTRPAHRGEFYAVCNLAETLITAGLNDHRLVGWLSDDPSPFFEIAIDQEIISLAVLNDEQKWLLLIDTQGNATVRQLTGERLVSEAIIGGTDYRLAVGPSPEDLAAFRAQKRDAEIQGLLREANDRIENEEYQDLEAIYDRLETLGRTREVLEMKVREAERKHDPVGELRARTELTDHLADSPDALAHLRELAALLRRLWQFEEAELIDDRIASRKPDCLAPGMAGHAHQYRDPFNSRDCVLVPNDDTDLETLMKTGTFLRKRFVGRLQIRIVREMVQDVGLSAGEIAKKFEEIADEEVNDLLPRPRIEDLSWLSADLAQSVPTVTFSSDASSEARGLQLALQVHSDRAQTVVIPVVLLDSGLLDQVPTCKEHNEAVIEAHRFTVSHSTRVNAWIARLLARAKRAIQYLVGLKKRRHDFSG